MDVTRKVSKTGKAGAHPATDTGEMAERQRSATGIYTKALRCVAMRIWELLKRQKRGENNEFNNAGVGNIKGTNC